MTPCTRCSAPADGDYCDTCLGTMKAQAWHGRDVVAAFQHHVGPVPPRPDDDEPGESPEDAA